MANVVTAGEAREVDGYRDSSNRLLGSRSLSVDVASMTDFYHCDDALIVVDNEENPEPALAESVTIVAREFLAPRRTWRVLQSVDLVDDAGAVRFPAYRFELFRRGWLDEKLIACHCASSP